MAFHESEQQEIYNHAMAIAKKMGLAHHDAEEVANDVLLRVSQTLEQERVHQVRSLTLVVARNLIVSRSRSRPHKQAQRTDSLNEKNDAGTSLLDTLTSEPEDPDAIETRIDVQNALRKLPIEQQELLFAVYVRGDTGDEIAARLGITQSTVSLRVKAARAAFQAVYQG